jgi:tetratricopeptide (TPR) repeat protein
MGMIDFARGLGAARSGDTAAAKASVERLEQLHKALVAAKQSYWAGQVAIQAKAVTAWVTYAEGRKEEALAIMREAADLESATEKHPVTPGPLLPARELLGVMLLETGQPSLALAEFEKTHAVEPNRFHGLAGAARAAELAGKRDEARVHYEKLTALAASADAVRPELIQERQFLQR